MSNRERRRRRREQVRQVMERLAAERAFREADYWARCPAGVTYTEAMKRMYAEER